MMKAAILILGMHRSGTSALTRVVSLMGASLPKSLLGRNNSNERGHWESRVMIEAHDKLLGELGSDWKDWRRLNLEQSAGRQKDATSVMFTETLAAEYKHADVAVIKEPRICRFARPYIETLETGGTQLHSIIMVRNPLEVAASLQARDGVEMLDGLYLWLTHMLEAELATRGRSRQFLSYDEFLSDPMRTATAISKSATFKLPYEVSEVSKQIQSYVSPDLKRQRAAIEDIALDPLASGWVSEAYEAFLVLCENPKSKGALKKLDSVSQSYFDIIGPLYDILNQERERLHTQRKEELSAAHVRHESAIASLQSQHKEAWEARDIKHTEVLKDIHAEHAAALQDMRAKHSEEMAAVINVHKDEQATTIAQMSDNMSHMRDEFGDMLRAVEQRANQSEAETQALKAELSSVLNSTSWKMTGGMRRLLNLIKGVNSPQTAAYLTAKEAPPRLEFKDPDHS